MDMQQTSSLSPEMMMCHALRAATNSNHEVVLKAEDQLSEWESLKCFFPTLTRICLSVVDGMDPLAVQQLDVNVRWMAAVYLKNGIYRYWRRGTKYELPQEEKQQIRKLLLLHFVDETVPQIFLQIASAISRIARIDCPSDWPQLLPELLKRLETNASNSVIGQHDSGEQQRVLLTMHYVLKAIASSQLWEVWPEKKVFEELTTNIYEFIYRLWDTYCTLFFHQLKEAPAMAKSTLENSVLCARILKKLTVYGFSKPEDSTECLRYIEVLFERLKVCLNCRFELRQVNADEHLVALLEKLILKQMKTLLEFQDSYARAFKSFVATALQFTFDHVFHVNAYLILTDNLVNFQQFAIICINLMMGLMSPFYWQKIDKSWNTETSKDLETRIVLKNFFTDERLSYICEKIITHYFILTQIELDLWLEDPEGFAQEENAGDMCKYALRPCMETLFSACFTIYQPQMSAEVLKYIQKAQQIQLSEKSDFKDILLKDAIYNAAGQAATNLFNDLDFDAWFSGQLLNELKIESVNFRILRRRIIWLLGEWAGVKFSLDLRPLAYEACLHLLRPCEDMSIRLASASCLSLLVDDFDFVPDTFMPYLEQSFNALFALLSEAKECDTKCKLLTIMSSLVEKLSDNIEPYSGNLVSFLPLLWKESEDYSMLRCAIISTFKQVVSAIQNLPETIRPFLYSVIRLSTDMMVSAKINKYFIILLL